MQRIRSDVESLKGHEDKYSLAISRKNDHLLEGYIIGPKGSPYEGGRFDIQVRITESFPEEEPKVDFKTKIFHPQNGHVCFCLLRKKWNPSMTIKDVIDYLENMLYCPALDAHASSEASKLFESDHAEFVKVAQEATRLFAIERRDSS